MKPRVRFAVPPVLTVGILALLAPPGLAAPVSEASPSAVLMLPDLKTLAPSGFAVTFEDGERKLRFNNEIANKSVGVLELTPEERDCDGDGDADNDRTALQRVYEDTNRDGRFTRGTDQAAGRRRVGCFVFHPDPDHNHWHFEDFALYQLYRMTDGKLIRSSDKVSFCIIDTSRAFPSIPGSPPSGFYTRCGQDDTTGLSAGWSDVYTSGLPGQELIITDVGDGEYCFVSTADPEDRLFERNDTNNKRSRLISLEGDTVQDLGGPCTPPTNRAG